jgi:predicted amidohydrolase
MDGIGVKYCGDSLIFDPNGMLCISADQNIECTVTDEISMDYLSECRIKFPVLLDSDDFTIKS